MINMNYDKFNPSLINRLIAKNMFDILKPHLDRIKKSSKIKEKQDQYISLQLFIQNLSGINSQLRIIILNCGSNLLKDVLKDSELNDLKYLIWKYDVIANYKLLIKQATNCDFLYWSPEIISASFKYFYENPKENQKIDFLLAALNDCASQINHLKHLESPGILLNSFKNEIISQFTNVLQ